MVFADPASARVTCDALLFDVISRRRSDLARPIVVGLCGPQGSGKSTMAARLACDLTHLGYPTAILSLDDFYFRRSERMVLARDVHPLLMTRGVPGTHDVDLMLRCLTSLLDPCGVASTLVPAFDKSCDDRAPEGEWLPVRGPICVVILEGWCVGARAQPARDLVQPVNELEREEDPDGRWRLYVNEKLSSSYSELFARLDLCVRLRAPSFEIIQDWRAEQEVGLRRSRHSSLPPMDPTALHRFISHYERLTRWMHRDESADLIIDLNAKRIPLGWHVGSTNSHFNRPLAPETS